MKPKTKMTLLLLMTLFIGVILGVLLRPLFIGNRFDDFRKLRSPGGITSRIEKILELDETQMKVIKPILENHEIKLRESGEKSRREFGNLMDSLKTELSEYLTVEQLEKLENRFNPRRSKEIHTKREN